MLTEEEATEQAATYLAANGSESYALRSCWNCNEAHEHLKERDYPILCFECGKWYFKGTCITAW